LISKLFLIDQFYQTYSELIKTLDPPSKHKQEKTGTKVKLIKLQTLHKQHQNKTNPEEKNMIF